MYCSPQCLVAKVPGVYRFVCPDGRSYVGSRLNVTKRERAGIRAQNSRLAKTLKKYPPHTWRFEILERLRPGCATEQLRTAEQRWIDRLRTWSASSGFNMLPAVYAGDGPAQKAGRRFKRKILSEMKERQREFLQAWRAERSVESHVQKNRPGVETPGAAK